MPDEGRLTIKTRDVHLDSTDALESCISGLATYQTLELEWMRHLGSNDNQEFIATNYPATLSMVGEGEPFQVSRKTPPCATDWIACGHNTAKQVPPSCRTDGYMIPLAPLVLAASANAFPAG